MVTFIFPLAGIIPEGKEMRGKKKYCQGCGHINTFFPG
jgi:hypothetical protein